MPGFVIGIGSQRAGSTLLHRLIDECTDVFMHPNKELHYFDTLFDVRRKGVLIDYSRKQMAREIEKIVSCDQHEFINKKYRCFLHANNLLSTGDLEKINYIDLYRPCILGNSVLGEVTPEYMLLPEKAVENMACALGADSKIILLSRSPVERFISSFKLLKVYSNPGYEMENFSRDLDRAMISMDSWMRQQDFFNDYETALDKYTKYFSSVLFESYENMQDNPERFLCRLRDFLETELNFEKAYAIMNKKINSLGDTAEVSAEAHQLLKERYKPYVDFLRKCTL